VSYPETVHGGLLAAILDDAMAYSINQAGIVAYTGKLEMRYRKPPKIGDKLIIRAWIEENKKSLYYTRGVIENNCGEKLVEAKAVFMRPVF
jgi:acyl-coenzyme A thioesterase PaaI-like protein